MSGPKAIASALGPASPTSESTTGQAPAEDGGPEVLERPVDPATQPSTVKLPSVAETDPNFLSTPVPAPLASNLLIRRAPVETRASRPDAEGRLSRTDAKAASLIAGRYRLGERIAAGGVGEVYRARQVDLDRDVAVRLLVDATERDGVRKRPLDPDELARFARDAKVTADIRHPGVVQVFDAGVTAEGTPYVAMEMLEGQTLAKRIGREGPLAAREAVRIAVDVCRALEAVHDKGVVHRNIQPSSIFLARTGDGGYAVKLIDFGVAKRVAVPEDVRTTGRVKLGLHGGSTHALGGSGDVVVGTPAYQSPEQLMGEAVDPRADLYALAVTLYEILAGAPPFTGDSDEATFNAILTAEPDSLRKRALRRDVPVALEQEVARALSKSREDRHTDAGDLASALEAAMTRRPSRSSISPASSRPPLAHGGPDGRAVVLLVAAAVAVVVVVLAVRHGSQPKTGDTVTPSPAQPGVAPQPAGTQARSRP